MTSKRHTVFLKNPHMTAMDSYVQNMAILLSKTTKQTNFDNSKQLQNKIPAKSQSILLKQA